MPQYVCNRSAAHWVNPDAFVPERWLDDGPPEYHQDDKAIMQPFSMGPRNCIGKK